MLKSLASLVLLVSATDAWGASRLTDAWGASRTTDFGVRTLVPEFGGRTRASEPMATAMPLRSSVDLRSVAGLGAQWGRVTSTYRSAAHNRAVGGVRNSYHLSGRAIDLARRPGVTHAQIAAAYRNAGYYLVESLDEGDHSHFAFGSAPLRIQRIAGFKELRAPAASTNWGIVSVASAAFK
jgi:hypothetical protein